MTAAFKLESEVLKLFNDNKYNTKFFSKLQTLTMAKYRVNIVWYCMTLLSRYVLIDGTTVSQ